MTEIFLDKLIFDSQLVSPLRGQRKLRGFAAQPSVEVVQQRENSPWQPPMSSQDFQPHAFTEQS